MHIPSRSCQEKKEYERDDSDKRIVHQSVPIFAVAVLHISQYTKFAMLFHEKTKKAVGVGFVVVAILVILSMILLSFPVWNF